MSTKISWTQETWNPTTGCDEVSAGCDFCYARELTKRYGWNDGNFNQVILHPERLRKPFSWKQPVRCFVNSMSDLFHKDVPDSFIQQVFDVMRQTPQHTYQILTKRPARMKLWHDWPENVWAGTSVEDRRVIARIDHLRQTPAQTRFLSCEPLIGPLGAVDLTGIHWVIVGGESGRHMTHPSNPRWMHMAWAREIRDQCAAAGIAFFFQQDSGPRTELRPYLVEDDGSHTVYHEYPETHPVSLQPALF